MAVAWVAEPSRVCNGRGGPSATPPAHARCLGPGGSVPTLSSPTTRAPRVKEVRLEEEGESLSQVEPGVLAPRGPWATAQQAGPHSNCINPFDAKAPHSPPSSVKGEENLPDQNAHSPAAPGLELRTPCPAFRSAYIPSLGRLEPPQSRETPSRLSAQEAAFPDHRCSPLPLASRAPGSGARGGGFSWSRSGAGGSRTRPERPRKPGQQVRAGQRAEGAGEVLEERVGSLRRQDSYLTGPSGWGSGTYGEACQERAWSRFLAAYPPRPLAVPAGLWV
ncbi:myristoylated alanine-rich C-kinase substrate-like [Gracilinanus agilis]|uniref:myristoylated alanine-rich C-kinase substrate-like n=1 Tax=Gracilinanus agilis TaxID=191870 RepID=UPI001CFD5250|nr:myristoylated alanine-rich C-kinase substrate-like [Gracilinanus agilis]